jgi:hypothetical protein
MQSCVAEVALDSESACVEQTLYKFQSKTVASLSTFWPDHAVGLTFNGDRELGMQILRSAHAVPIDRNGCDASVAKVSLPAADAPGTAGMRLPTTDPLSVCLYTSGRRLAASARLTGEGAATVAARANAVSGRFDPACDRPTVADMYALMLTVSSSTRAVYVPPCGGSAYAQLAVALGQLADIPIT